MIFKSRDLNKYSSKRQVEYCLKAAEIKLHTDRIRVIYLFTLKNHERTT